MDEHSRYVCFSLADDQIQTYANDGTRVEERVANILDMVAYCYPELTEAVLRTWLALGGIDLTDYNEWQICSDYVSWYVGEQAIDLTELDTYTMLNLDSQIRMRGLTNPVMQAHMDALKLEGMHFRTVIAPNVWDIEKL